MPVMVRVGAVHLGWDVVSVAAGGSGVPIRPVQVEGSYNPPAYLLADATGRLYTAGVDRQRPDLGMAIPDVRDILGHPQIVIAGATWPAELVFRARLYNPLAAIGKHLRGKPDVVALPYPDDWPDPKIDAYAQLVEQLDVAVEPIPESIALSGYVRALGLVRAPDHQLPQGVGATAVHFDGQVVDGRANVLVVAVHGDEERPTESVYVEIDPESTRDPRIADDTVIEVMAAARAIGADNSTVLLAGQVVFNETLRFAFRNHLGQRLKKAEHPMHALVLGATHLLVSENDDEEEDPAAYPYPTAPTPSGAAADPHRPGPGSSYALSVPAGTGRPDPVRAGGVSGAGQATGTLWNKMTGNLFGVPTVACAAALVAAVSGIDNAGVAPPPAPVASASSVVGSGGVAPAWHGTPVCVLMPQTTIEPPESERSPGVHSLYARESGPRGPAAPEPEARAPGGDDCGGSGVDNLRYLVPVAPGVADPGLPIHI